jgi:hypothetical protein
MADGYCDYDCQLIFADKTPALLLLEEFKQSDQGVYRYVRSKQYSRAYYYVKILSNPIRESTGNQGFTVNNLIRKLIGMRVVKQSNHAGSLQSACTVCQESKQSLPAVYMYVRILSNPIRESTGTSISGVSAIKSGSS